jgi:tetratricopeptide (TPR) repeat protein
MSAAIIKRNKPLSKKHALRASQLLQTALTFHQAGDFQQAQTLYLSITNKYPNYPDAIYLLGMLANQTGQYDLAIDSFKKTININPNFIEAYNNLGNTLQITGRINEAVICLKKAIDIKPDFVEAHYNLGNSLQTLGQFEEAITHYKHALIIKPDFAEAHYNLGNSLQTLGQFEEAITHYKQVLIINPRSTETLNNLGMALQQLGRQEESISYYEQALAINPNYAEAHNNLGIPLQDLNRLEDAAAHYEKALTIKPNYARAHLHLSKIKPDLQQASIIENHLKSHSISDEDAMDYHYALGNISSDNKSYSKEFEHYLIGNTIKRKLIDYDAQKNTDFVNSLIENFSKNYFQEKAGFGNNSELPVFILGMPRSGTTLVEQIISNHPHVYGAGELVHLHNTVDAISKNIDSSTSYPGCISLFSETMVNEYSNEYLEILKNYSQVSTRISDKTPSNFFRIGIIKTLFPKARIIHCQRNALDTCISIFLNNFSRGNEYSFDLTEIGKYYLDYERLMLHWHTLFPSEIYDVQYEELISNQNEISQQLINYLGLEWDDACLDFHKNKRAVKTASNLQVRQPIYNNSVERWKRYEEHLQPLISVLQNSAESQNEN